MSIKVTLPWGAHFAGGKISLQYCNCIFHRRWSFQRLRLRDIAWHSLLLRQNYFPCWTWVLYSHSGRLRLQYSPSKSIHSMIRVTSLLPRWKWRWKNFIRVHYVTYFTLLQWFSNNSLCCGFLSRGIQFVKNTNLHVLFQISCLAERSCANKFCQIQNSHHSL